jgi:hypothetical protein
MMTLRQLAAEPPTLPTRTVALESGFATHLPRSRSVREVEKDCEMGITYLIGYSIRY